MLHVQPQTLADAHQFRPALPESDEVVIRFDGRMREGREPEIFAILPVNGLARAPSRILAKVEDLVSGAGADAPVFRRTHGGPALYLPLEIPEHEALLAEFQAAVPSRPLTADLRLLFGADGMGAFSRTAAFEAPENNFETIGVEQALDHLVEARQTLIRTSLGLQDRRPENEDEAPTLS